ncbi:hypothetical protein SAMN05443633_10839 [Chryseobacterium arachidis]|uniref:Uncharacterized protein n=1 Tax=Chryseobacterium arachidis TaxID=1416778 RepID=A0A1M5FJB1_9FLAO|nr:hypothetical protein [Chryseobacterium arachidis]SHF91576.1 hypothetical protein SAMN05443633_10839 [Chryseobacterium arachidis]
MLKNLITLFTVSVFFSCQKDHTTINKRKPDTLKSYPTEKQITKKYTDPKKSDPYRCTIDNALQTIIKLPEVQKESAFVDSISAGKKALSFMLDSLDMGSKPFYMVKTGFNGEMRWETYTTFYIDKNNCKTIFVDEVVSGDILSLEDWRKSQK